MDVNELVDQVTQDTIDWFGETAAQDLTVFAMGVAGEAGEFANLVKKLMRDNIDFMDIYDHLKDELTDVLIYVLCLAGCLNVDLQAEYDKKRTFNAERFGGENARSADPAI